jgi:DNA-binding MarR family transcriptional regulator
MKINLEVAVQDLLHVVSVLVRRVRAAAGDGGMSLSEAAVLKRLAEDGSATTAELARVERMKPQSMGAIIAGLEEDGLVTRQAHSTDGRQMLIQLTAKGTAQQEDRRAAKKDWLVKALGRLEKEEQETLVRAIGILRRVAEK